MGVQGLTTYVEGNRNFLQDVRFRDSRLVIDGCSLYFRLYFNHCLDQQHGGDYDAFACLLTQFLSALAACDIKPYVVLDGGKAALEARIQFPYFRQTKLFTIYKVCIYIQDIIQRGKSSRSFNFSF